MNEQKNGKQDYVVRRNPTFNISLIKRFDRENDRYFPHIYYYFTLNKTVYRGTTKTSDLDESERISIQKYIDVKEKRTVGKVVKFESIVKRFLKYIEKRVSPKTFIEYDRQSGLLIEKFKGKDIHTFKQGDYNDYQYWRESYYSSHKRKRIQRYERNGKKLKGCHFKEVGNSTINREIGLLVTILRYSQKQLSYLENMTIPSWTKLEERVRKETVSGREYFQLKRYWEEKNPYYWKIISWVDSTGTRYPSEVNNLVWGDVDLKGSYVIIRNRKSKKGTIDTKVPLMEETKKILEELRRREGIPRGQNDPVFVNDKGVPVKNITKSFKKSLLDLGINKKLSMYSFRHTFTTRMVKTDIPLKVLSYVLGHKSTEMIEKHYSHLTEKDVIRTFQRMEKEKKEKSKKK